MKISDEEQAADQLHRALKQEGRDAGRPETIKDDPPDLIVCVDGESWGVEVTRWDQLVTYRGTQVAATLGVTKGFFELVKRIRNETKDHWQSNSKRYRIWLVAEPAEKSIHKWRRKVLEGAKTFIASDEEGEHALDGVIVEHIPKKFWAKDKGPDVIGVDEYRLNAASADIHANVTEAVAEALNRKAGHISRWSGDFDKRCLLLIGHDYFFADERGTLHRAINEILSNRKDLRSFDFIYAWDDRGCGQVWPDPIIDSTS